MHISSLKPIILIYPLFIEFLFGNLNLHYANNNINIKKIIPFIEV